MLRFSGALAMLLATGLAAPGSAAVRAPHPEPPWPAKCPIRTAVLIDQSSSMAGAFDDVEAAAHDFVDALRGTPTEIMLIGFGTDARVVAAPTPVAQDGPRHALKDALAGLSTYPENDPEGGTNWAAALRLVRGQHIDVAVLLTDGAPTVYGSPPRNPTSATDPAPLQEAVAVADALKAARTRVTPIGLGMQEGATANLAALSGPAEGQDYFTVDVARLRRELYEIASQACGVPVAALPTPEAPGFPLKTAALVALGLLAVVALAGWMVLKVRSGGRRPATAATAMAAAGGPPPGRAPAPGRRAPLRVEDLETGVRRPPAPPPGEGPPPPGRKP